MTLSYDGLGRRSDRTDAVGTETAHYGDLSDRAIIDTDSAGIVASYVNGPSPTAGFLEQRRGAVTEYPVADARGDVTALLDGLGGISSQQTYDPWGVQVTGTPQEMGFLGAHQRRTDIMTGLTQMGVREYDSTVGSFASEDPIMGNYGFGQSLNRHAYAWDNPLTILDLTGLSIFGDAVGAIRDGASAAGRAVANVAGDVVRGAKDLVGQAARAACAAGQYGAFGMYTPLAYAACPNGRDIISGAANFVADRAHDAYKFVANNSCGISAGIGDGMFGTLRPGIRARWSRLGLKGGIGWGAGAAVHADCTPGGSV